MIKAIIGLGNPGQKYKDTRHNVGFMVADAVAKAIKCDNKYKEKDFSHIYECPDYDVIIAKPQTYMNLSGNAVLNLLEDYNLKPSEILVVHDDLDLNLGTIRLRTKGSSGGHNGLKSIIGMIKTEEFPRLKIGIGRPARKEEVSDYVLSPFTKEEKFVLDKVIAASTECILNVLKYGIEKSMGSCNKSVI
ncbi:peptidyl-tRNA hydrolase [Sulfurihydrogenibium azorense Az-Fu1]|uniref:Peptidyl-tRNA hydrolase n=1 Tax=Sulfurihydrogenibium azorense (strain DSM 15241 / OCM 825 / Az-Fu1) TaxID=204536 RepID=C1DTM7_SULAA|nr:aminoacyl-tRNA hydrolase [Sulfurihydrogenibium azorense]ACN98366.1 peptidyl-tRNA hydrolase [Sulfurihydrogenibium azorense Az-Fu1]